MTEAFIKKEQLVRDITAKSLAEPYFKKAKSNLITMEILSKVEKHKELLAIPKEHSTDEWIVVVAYYSMYMAALSLLAKIGFKSKSHTATAVALEEFFVKKKLLDKTQLENLESVRMRKEEVEILKDVKDRREIAQYSVTKRTTKELAEKTKEDARTFVDKIEEIFEHFSFGL
ncbi:MAG: HEPN domain-containing protein [Nanoarchaeota archaeon]